MNPLVDSFVQELLNGVEPAAIEAGLASKDIAIAAAHGFLQGKLGLIEDWINSLIDKSLSPDDFKQMAKDLGVNALEVCLKVAGLAEVEVDKIGRAHV